MPAPKETPSNPDKRQAWLVYLTSVEQHLDRKVTTEEKAILIDAFNETYREQPQFLADNKYIPVYSSPRASNQAGHIGGDTTIMARGTQYLRNDPSFKHAAYMLREIWNMRYTDMSQRFEPYAQFKDDITGLVNYIFSAYDSQAIDDAHRRVIEKYRNGELNNRGRGRGSRNKGGTTPRWAEANDKTTSEINGYFDNGQTDTTGTSNDNANATTTNGSTHTTEQTTNSAETNSNMSDYVLNSIFEEYKQRTQRTLEILNMDIGSFDSHINSRINSLKTDIFTVVTDELLKTNKRIDDIKLAAPTIVIIKNETTQQTQDMGLQHFQFPNLIKAVQARDHKNNRLNIWMHGPAGTGKTTAAEMACSALSLRFSAMGALDMAAEILGWNGADAKTYQRTAFRETWEHGGGIMLDEVDSYSPNAALGLQNALANGFCMFPDNPTHPIKRHPDCVIMGGANTTGNGPTLEFTGRNKMDAAFLNRWSKLQWPIDLALEDALADNKDWLARVRHIRARVKAHEIKVSITPRAVVYGCALLRAGLDWATVEEMTLREGMSDAQWNKVA